MSDDLITWLRAQLDEDEAEIRKHPDDDGVWVPGNFEATEESNYPCTPVLLVSKTFALADIDAKRRLLQQFELRGNAVRATVQPSTGGVWDDLLRMLAVPYADQPGYRDEWRP